MTKKSVAFLCLALVLPACDRAEDSRQGEKPTRETQRPPVIGTNALLNGGFEEGTKPWFFLEGNRHWAGFTVSPEAAHSGNAGARIVMDAAATSPKSKVFGLIQEVTPTRFPQSIVGHYRVEKWNRVTTKQYLQFVVIVTGDPTGSGWSNYQIRYILTGIDRPPFRIRNARFVFMGPRDPVIGRWVRFERNVADDFKSLWGRVPTGNSKIRVLFEVRHDDKEPGAAGVLAEVDYDDLFFGWKE